MKSTPKFHHRRSIRMQGYDYSLPGAYFVTLVTRDRIDLFGDITAGSMQRNHIGEIVRSAWQRLPDSFSIQLDEWVIMPNHLHGIIWIMDSDQGEASTNQRPTESIEPWVDASPLQKPTGTQQGSLGAVIQNFKSISTRKIHQFLGNCEPFWSAVGVKHLPGIKSMEAQQKWQMLHPKLSPNASPKNIWQRNYYDRIIRDEKELDLVRLYIQENPSQWANDPENRNHQLP